MTHASDERIAGLTALFRDNLNVDVSDPHLDLIEEGLLDSLMLVDLLMHLEQQFQVTVPLEDLELDNFRTVHAIDSYITSRVA